ncbi:NUDIX hydrolase [Halohasta salina]|uniref:NUDIX hydrolase n=1 Tax=Halohasta salina TaxID=2961621 RepID=UPI0020A58E6B|nr:CoA pyrophosphatase [Halohasta salina]
MDLTGVGRHTPSKLTDPEREAAVLAPVIRQDGREEILFTKRSEQLGDHPGQMSFPGGSREPEDDDLEATALREAHEEIGLSPSEADVVGVIDDIETVTRYIVRPYVGVIPDRAYTPDEYEVAEIVRLSVAALTDPTNYESEYRDHPEYGPIRIHYFHVDGYTVWGATGRMLAQLLELTTDWEVPPEVDRVADPDAELPI